MQQLVSVCCTARYSLYIVWTVCAYCRTCVVHLAIVVLKHGVLPAHPLLTEVTHGEGLSGRVRESEEMRSGLSGVMSGVEMDTEWQS